MIRIVFNKLLNGWFVVRGCLQHQAPISGRFNSRAEAQAWLTKRNDKNIDRIISAVIREVK